MKKRITLVLCILLFSMYFSAEAQQKNDWYVETTAFTPYLSKNPDVVVPELRFNKDNKVSLVLTDIGKSIIAHLYDYNQDGNLEQITLLFVKDKKTDNKYYVLDTLLTKQQFDDLIQKILDRLTNDRKTPQN